MCRVLMILLRVCYAENQLSQLVLDDSDSDNDATNNGSLTIAEIEKVLDEINFPDLLSRFKYRPRKPFVRIANKIFNKGYRMFCRLTE